jgi:hypothetical protein
MEASIGSINGGKDCWGSVEYRGCRSKTNASQQARQEHSGIARPVCLQRSGFLIDPKTAAELIPAQPFDRICSTKRGAARSSPDLTMTSPSTAS